MDKIWYWIRSYNAINSARMPTGQPSVTIFLPGSEDIKESYMLLQTPSDHPELLLRMIWDHIYSYICEQVKMAEVAAVLIYLNCSWRFSTFSTWGFSTWRHLEHSLPSKNLSSHRFIQTTLVVKSWPPLPTLACNIELQEIIRHEGLSYWQVIFLFSHLVNQPAQLL